jgi:hypothetical protein
MGPIPEIVERINKQLRDEYGIEVTSDRPIYRVVWSNDEFEKRLMKYTDAGVELLTPEVREVPKYKQWAADRYILEMLQYIDSPLSSTEEMTVQVVSYEPIWSFVDNQLNYLPPRYDVAKIIIDSRLERLGKKAPVAKDPMENLEEKRAHIAKIQEELFGNETNTGDALAHGEGVTVPRNYEKGVH